MGDGRDTPLTDRITASPMKASSLLLQAGRPVLKTPRVLVLAGRRYPADIGVTMLHHTSESKRDQFLLNLMSTPPIR